MTGPKLLPDPVDAAIAATEEPVQIAMRQINVTITSTGRPAAVVLPVDATDSEIAEVCGWILTAVMNTHRQERASATSRILVPTPGRFVRA